jgi:hypothetical protein
MGSQATPASPIQSATDTTTLAATAAKPTAELSAIQPSIVVSIAAARPILLRIALNPEDLFKGKHPT